VIQSPLSFDLERFEYFPATRESGVLRLSGRWRCAIAEVFEPPSLVVDCRNESQNTPALPPLAPIAGGPEPELWRAGFGAFKAVVEDPDGRWFLHWADDEIELPAPVVAPASPSHEALRERRQTAGRRAVDRRVPSLARAVGAIAEDEREAAHLKLERMRVAVQNARSERDVARARAEHAGTRAAASQREADEARAEAKAAQEEAAAVRAEAAAHAEIHRAQGTVDQALARAHQADAEAGRLAVAALRREVEAGVVAAEELRGELLARLDEERVAVERSRSERLESERLLAQRFDEQADEARGELERLRVGLGEAEAQAGVAQVEAQAAFVEVAQLRAELVDARVEVAEAQAQLVEARGRAEGAEASAEAAGRQADEARGELERARSQARDEVKAAGESAAVAVSRATQSVTEIETTVEFARCEAEEARRDAARLRAHAEASEARLQGMVDSGESRNAALLLRVADAEARARATVEHDRHAIKREQRDAERLLEIARERERGDTSPPP